ncbi:MAG: hypothetical protein ACW98D_16510 [Promethearchaeota archaeon]|jgi:hypothetical protein
MSIKKKKLIGIFILGIFIFSLSFGFVAATDDDGDGVEDEFEDEKTRNVSITIEDGKIEIESVLRANLTKNKIEFELRNNTNGLEVGVSFTPNYDPLSNASEIELEFEITFKELVEYVDVDLNNVFDDNIDTEIKVLPLDSFQTTQHSTIAISPDTDLHYFIVNTTDGIFTAHIYIAEEFEIVNSSLILPSETKIAIEINDFNYTNSNSRLALYTKLESGVDYEEKEDTEDELQGYATDEQGVFTTNNTHVGFFSWETNATVDGMSKPVFASEADIDDTEPNEQKIYLNYPNGSVIIHDPKIGIEGLSILSEPEAAIPGYIMYIFLGASFIGIVSIIYKLKKKC